MYHTVSTLIFIISWTFCPNCTKIVQPILINAHRFTNINPLSTKFFVQPFGNIFYFSILQRWLLKLSQFQNKLPKVFTDVCQLCFQFKIFFMIHFWLVTKKNVFSAPNVAIWVIGWVNTTLWGSCVKPNWCTDTIIFWSEILCVKCVR